MMSPLTSTLFFYPLIIVGFFITCVILGRDEFRRSYLESISIFITYLSLSERRSDDL